MADTSFESTRSGGGSGGGIGGSSIDVQATPSGAVESYYTRLPIESPQHLFASPQLLTPQPTPSHQVQQHQYRYRTPTSQLGHVAGAGGLFSGPIPLGSLVTPVGTRHTTAMSHHQTLMALRQLQEHELAQTQDISYRIYVRKLVSVSVYAFL